MHEIIDTFAEPPGSDKSYARLVCWGLFVGQTVEGGCAASATSEICSCRLQYFLRPTLRAYLFSWFALLLAERLLVFEKTIFFIYQPG